MPSLSELANLHIASRQSSLEQFAAGPARSTAVHEMRTAFAAGYQAASDPAAAAPLVRAGRDRERERISGILGCPEAKGRTELAQHLAFETDATLDAARSMLVTVPEDRSSGLLGRDQRAVFDAALRAHDIDPRGVSVLSSAMRSEGVSVVPDQPGPEPRAPGADAINPSAIYARRAEQAAAAAKAYERPAA